MVGPENQTTSVAWVAEWVQLITSDNKPNISEVRLLLINFWCLTPLLNERLLEYPLPSFCFLCGSEFFFFIPVKKRWLVFQYEY
jgi:hypothetical protein